MQHACKEYLLMRGFQNNRIHNKGRLNHLKNPIAAFIRNLVMKYTPIVSMRTEKIWNYDADSELKKFL